MYSDIVIRFSSVPSDRYVYARAFFPTTAHGQL